MSYKLKDDPAHPDQITFLYSSFVQYFFGAILFFLGFLPALTGVFLLLGGDRSPITFQSTGFGLVFLGGALLLLRSSRPERFVFDNELGVLWIEEKLPKKAKATNGEKRKRTPLPYSEFDHFGVEEDGESESHPYELCLFKKDGASWILASFREEKEAKAACDEASKRVDFSRPSRLKEEPTPAFFEERKEASNTTLRWPRNKDKKQTLVYLMFVLGFVLLIRGFQEGMEKPLFLLLFVGLSALWTAIALDFLSSFGQTQVIEITSDLLRFKQEGGLFRKKTIEMPLHEIESILFCFRYNTMGEHIQFFRQGEQTKAKQIKRGKSPELSPKERLHLQPRKTEFLFEGLTVGDLAVLEHRLQEIIYERSGHRPA